MLRAKGPCGFTRHRLPDGDVLPVLRRFQLALTGQARILTGGLGISWSSCDETAGGPGVLPFLGCFPQRLDLLPPYTLLSWPANKIWLVSSTLYRINGRPNVC